MFLFQLFQEKTCHWPYILFFGFLIFGFDELLQTTSLLVVTECITLQNSDAKLFATVVAVKCGVGGGHYFVSRNMLPCKDTWHSSWFGANLVVETPL